VRPAVAIIRLMSDSSTSPATPASPQAFVPPKFTLKSSS